jgi:S1-C subfamily serine protease
MGGTTRFEGPVVGITEAKGGTLARSDLAGIVGGGLLHRFRVIYDCPHGKIYLEPTGRVGERFEHDMAGLKWLNTGEGRREFRVRSVRAGSPAGEAGLRPGEVLVRVDGKEAGEFDRSRLAGYLQREGRAVRMEVKRGEVLMAVEFQLKRML